MRRTVRVNVPELLEQVSALRARASEITVRIRRGVGLLSDVHHDVSAALNVLASICVIDKRHLSSALSPPPGPAPVRFLRIHEVVDRVGLSRSHVWRMVKGGGFPKPRRLSSRAIAWPE